jgi:hypothetical protein
MPENPHSPPHQPNHNEDHATLKETVRKPLDFLGSNLRFGL